MVYKSNPMREDQLPKQNIVLCGIVCFVSNISNM
uniref:Uncharacterized protein n=1 Tax=Anguilla anguilla TaxID=7936 RepID=A0A0E9VK29_ANGAN